MNLAIIHGRLGKDPEVKTTQGGAKIAKFSVATSERVKQRDGTYKEETEWHNVVVFGKTAENCGQYLEKGREVLVEGRLKTSSWENEQGKKQYRTEINAYNVQFIGGSKSYDRREDGVETRTHSAPKGRQEKREKEEDQNQELESAFSGNYTPGLDEIPF